MIRFAQGIVDKDKFYLPKNKAVRFDGHKLWFNVTKDKAKALKKDYSGINRIRFFC